MHGPCIAEELRFFADIALLVAVGTARFEAQCAVVLGLLLAGSILTLNDPLPVDFCFLLLPQPASGLGNRLLFRFLPKSSLFGRWAWLFSS